MKKLSLAVYLILVIAAIGCGKKSVETPVEEPTKFTTPAWKADETGKYSASMTAVVTLPQTLAASVTENDKLAAFVNDECRGVGVVVKVSDDNLFFVLIQGLSDEANKVTFKYFSSKTSYMFEARPALNFLVDAVYGTAASPKTLDVVQLK